MKLINQSVKQLNQELTLEGAMKAAEYAGRICYNSTDKITEDSYKGFIKGLVARGHMSPLAHGIIYFDFPKDFNNTYLTILKHNNFSYTISSKTRVFVATNLRVLYENFNQKEINTMLPYITNDDKGIKYSSFEVITSIGVSRELNRHAVSLAICEQSTRFCNFSKDKFNREITFIKPEWYYKCKDYVQKEFVSTLGLLETNYMNWLNLGLKPEQARAMLPLETATRVIYTGLNIDWLHVLLLRSSNMGAKNVHPECAEIANLIANKFDFNIKDV